MPALPSREAATRISSEEVDASESSRQRGALTSRGPSSSELAPADLNGALPRIRGGGARQAPGTPGLKLDPRSGACLRSPPMRELAARIALVNLLVNARHAVRTDEPAAGAPRSRSTTRSGPGERPSTVIADRGVRHRRRRICHASIRTSRDQTRRHWTWACRLPRTSSKALAACSAW